MLIKRVQTEAYGLIQAMLRAGFPEDTMRAQQVMCMAEEAGEAVKAARRYMGLARTPGTLKALTDELADVVIASAAMAEVFEIDLDSAVEQRLRVVLGRPVRADPYDPDTAPRLPESG